MAVTGKGRGKFHSAWAFHRPNCSGTDTLRKWVTTTHNEGRVAWLDWWLGEAGGGPTYYGILKRWTGSVWVKEPLKRWTGAAWVSAVIKRWTGSAWALVDTTGV